MHIRLGILAVVSVALIACGSSGSSTRYKGKEVMSVNGEIITDGYLEFLGSVNPRIRGQLSTPMGRKQLIDNIIEQELFYQGALKEGLDRAPQVKDKVDLYRRVIIAQSYVENTMEDEAQKYYDDHKSEFEKLRLSHILIPIKSAAEAVRTPMPKGVQPAAPKGHSELEAQAIAQKARSEIKSKDDFGAVAQKYSEDPITKNNSGDLGEASRTAPHMVRKGYEPLLEKAFTMQVGDVSEPIKTSDGYHIIMVTRGIEVEPFDSAKQGMMFKMQGETRNKLLADLKKNAKITYADPSLKPEEPVPPAAANTGTPPAQPPVATPPPASKPDAAPTQ
jgi:peptidyl-prolyl cis-trans isomerase C